MQPTYWHATTSSMAKTPLTESQEKFAAGVARGFNLTRAAREAGYAAPRQEAHRLLRDGRIRDLIFKKQELALVELGNKALDVVADIMSDASHKPETRLQAAALTLREIGRVRDRSLKDTTALLDKPRDLSVDDFQAALDKLINAVKPSVILDQEAVEAETTT